MAFREGRKRLIEAFEDFSSKRSRSVGHDLSGPLHGVVICLTGLASDKKSHLHELVTKLGGSYTREFNLDRNTHLVAQVKEGAKYDLAASDSRIKVVSPSWLEACGRSGTRVNEDSYKVGSTELDMGANTLSTGNKPGYRQILHSLLEERKISSCLFEYHQFYLLGFENDPDIKALLGKVIRSGGGTIHWDISNDVTLLIVHDTCHEALRKTSQWLSIHHTNLPPAISPHWVIDSFQKRTLARTNEYPPIMGKSHSVEKSLTKPSKLALSRSHSTLATLFRGLLFALSRVAPPTGTVDFDSKEQESIIRKHGGQILSLKLMDAMKTDSKSSSQRRKCYVVCWGGAPRLELNPILSQLKRNDICDLILVTPIWLKTCISIQKLIPPSRMLEVFAPRALPWKSMEAMDLRVSLSGFTAMEKMALMTLMKICGVCFMNEMTTKCTHLICKQNTPGLKLQKAMEWGLHIVSINWLFYILQYGYSGDDSSREGCENRFALILNDSVADQP